MSKGKKAMYGIFVAMYPVNGVIDDKEKMFPKPLEDVMIEYGSFDFVKFVKKTLANAMDEFGVIEDEQSVNELIIKTSGVTKISFDRYMKLLRDNNVIRKINNRMLVINPYQLYKSTTISGEKLWQIQANWELKKVMTKWFSVTDIDRLELAVSKAELDKAWATDKIKEIEDVNTEVANIYRDMDKYNDAIIKFFTYQKDSGNVAENQSYKEFMSKDTGSRHFRAWYMKVKDSIGLPDIKYDYRQRKAYADAFIAVALKIKGESDK